MDSVDLRAMPRLRLTPEEARLAPVPIGLSKAPVMRHGSMELRWHTPNGHSDQTPHDKDEVYVVVSGTAVFVRAEESTPFGDDLLPSLSGEESVTVQPGDALFVPAGTWHRFEAASSDFGAWAVFYGPEGGERG